MLHDEWKSQLLKEFVLGDLRFMRALGGHMLVEAVPSQDELYA